MFARVTRSGVMSGRTVRGVISGAKQFSSSSSGAKTGQLNRQRAFLASCVGVGGMATMATLMNAQVPLRYENSRDTKILALLLWCK